MSISVSNVGVQVSSETTEEKAGIEEVETAEEVVEFTGHAIGGVCAFAIEHPDVKVYTDISLKRFETVFPACGSSNSAIEFTCDELFKYSKSLEWIDVAKLPEVQE